MVQEVVRANHLVDFNVAAAARRNITREDLNLSLMPQGQFEEIANEEGTLRQHTEVTEEHRSVSGRTGMANLDPFFDGDDALKDKADSLRVNLKNLKGMAWWALEILPTMYECQDKDGRWWMQLRQVIPPVFRTLRLR